MSAPTPESIRDLAAGYALGALTPEETRAFEAAMAQSPELARDVAEFREVNALLAHSATLPPRPAIKDRLLREVRQAKVVPLPAPRRWLSPALGLAAAASAVLALGLQRRVGELSETLAARDSTLAATEAQLARREATLNTLLMAETDLQVVQLAATGAAAPPGIQFFWNKRANTAVLHAFRLPPAPPGKTYQFWVLRDGQPIASTTFDADPDGHSLVQPFALPAGGGFEAGAVTLEPAGGSATPTLPILLFGKA
ncbi:MAG: anti-sigma factor [Gemmatimonadales bacterium]